MYRFLVATVAVDVFDDDGNLRDSLLGAWSTESLDLAPQDVLSHVRGSLGITWAQASPERVRAAVERSRRGSIAYEQLDLFT